MPWVMTGRSAARLRPGLAMPPTAVIAADEAAVVRNRRRVSAPVGRVTAIGPPPPNQLRRKLTASSDRGSTLSRRLCERGDDGTDTARAMLGSCALPGHFCFALLRLIPQQHSETI